MRNRVVGWLAMVGLAMALAPQARAADLWAAAAAGDIPAIKAALATGGVDVNARDQAKGWTPLNYACDAGKADAVKALLDAGADVNKPSAKGSYPIGFAANFGSVEIVRLLAAKGADLHATTPPFPVPLGNAAGEGHLDVIREMLKLGAEVDAANRRGETALFYAADAGKTDAALLLIASGATVDARNNGGLTPAVYAAAAGKLDTLKALAAKGARLDVGDGGWTLIGQAAKAKRTDVVLYLVDEAGIDIDTTARFEPTPLAVAMQTGNAQLMRELIRRGARMDVGSQLLASTIKAGRVECARMAMDTGVRLNEMDLVELLSDVPQKGDVEASLLVLENARQLAGGPAASPADEQLIRAAVAGDTAKITRLGADGAVTNADAYHVAIKLAKDAAGAGAGSTAHTLRIAGSKVIRTAEANESATERLVDAAKAGDLKAITAALAAGTPADARVRGQRDDAMSLAIAGDHVEVVKLLIAKGYDVKAERPYVTHPLRYLSDRKTAVEIAKALLDAGASPNVFCDSFYPLASAAFNGRTELVEVLARGGAKLNARCTDEDQTALMFAAERGHAETAAALIKLKAKTGLRNVRGATALDLARANGHAEVVTVLRAARAPAGEGGQPALIDQMANGPDAVKRLLDAGADPEQYDPRWQERPFVYAVKNASRDGHGVAVVQALLDAGVDPAEHPGILIDAVYGNSNPKGQGVPLVRLLIEKGADVNATGRWASHWTPLLMAADVGNLDACKLLVDAGANLDAKRDDGATALDLATKKGHKAVAAYLKEAASKPRNPPAAKP